MEFSPEVEDDRDEAFIIYWLLRAAIAVYAIATDLDLATQPPSD
jgi:hypothetical protein